MADALGLHLAFGPVVRRERRRLALTQERLGMRAGLGELAATAAETLSQIERGARSNPGLLTIEKLAAGLGMRPSELLALVEAYAAAPGAADHCHTEDHRASPASPQEPAFADIERARGLLGDAHPAFTTAGTETGDSSPGIHRVEDLTA